MLAPRSAVLVILCGRLSFLVLTPTLPSVGEDRSDSVVRDELEHLVDGVANVRGHSYRMRRYEGQQLS